MERQLLFLLDYDLRMEESELLTHFAPFLRKPTASTSTLRTRSTVTEPRVETSADYPTTPKRSNHVVTALLTPSPSPLPSRTRVNSKSRVSPGSTSSNESGLTEDHGSDSSEDMEIDSRGVLSRRRNSPTQSRYSGAQPSSVRRQAKVSSGPITPSDEVASYTLGTGYATPLETSPIRRASYVEPSLRTQRSGSFLRIFEKISGVGHRSNKTNLPSDVDVVM